MTDQNVNKTRVREGNLGYTAIAELGGETYFANPRFTGWMRIQDFDMQKHGFSLAAFNRDGFAEYHMNKSGIVTALQHLKHAWRKGGESPVFKSLAPMTVEITPQTIDAINWSERSTLKKALEKMHQSYVIREVLGHKETLAVMGAVRDKLSLKDHFAMQAKGALSDDHTTLKLPAGFCIVRFDDNPASAGGEVLVSSQSGKFKEFRDTQSLATLLKAHPYACMQRNGALVDAIESLPEKDRNLVQVCSLKINIDLSGRAAISAEDVLKVQLAHAKSLENEAGRLKAQVQAFMPK